MNLKNRRRFPIGTQNFADLRKKNCIYVDKTQTLLELIALNDQCFMSRPRRFGKSLTLSTLKHLFQCDRHLFKDLWIDGQDEDGQDLWEWNNPRPVIHISLGSGEFHRSGNVRMRLIQEVSDNAARLNVSIDPQSPQSAFQSLCASFKSQNQEFVILIDEYDKPVLEVLEQNGSEILAENRAELRAFYSVLKDASPYFLLLTGVGKLTKASVFSELNNLEDLTFKQDVATLCGITQRELEDNFAPEISKIAQEQNVSEVELLAKIKDHYNGFRFAEKAESVYNPFSTLQLMKSGMFENYWAESGTPRFLAEQMKKNDLEVRDVEKVWTAKSNLTAIDPDKLKILPLLLQTGYLTIADSREDDIFLDFPNFEVKSSFIHELIPLSLKKNTTEIADPALAMGRALLKNDLDTFIHQVQKVFTQIAYQLDDATEKRYHALFHGMAVLACGKKALVLSEVPNSLGRSDLVIDMPSVCWIFEFKRDTDTAEAMAQIKTKQYSQAWEDRILPDGSIKPVKKVAVVFGTEQRNIVAWDIT
jgi:hypothetical protein